jgi:hypothetical protein
MSAGAFSVSRYQANDSARIYAIKIQPETIAAAPGGTANAVPTAATTEPVYARVIKSKNAYGVKARSVRIRFTAAPPTGYLVGQTYSIPILTATVWNAIAPGQVGTYLGTACVVVSKSPELIK